ncbi:MAG: protein translocase subunit SecD [Bacillota bacterium]
MRWGKILIMTVIILLVAGAAALAMAPVPKSVAERWPWAAQNLPWYKDINLGLDLQGGVHVVFEAVDTPEAPITEDSMNRLIAVLERRVDGFGVAEPVIQKQGERRVIIELAGITDPEKAVEDMVRTAYLEFKTDDGQTVLTGADLNDARESREPVSGLVDVNLTFTPAGANKFARITTENVGRQLGIYLDGELLQNPVINEPIIGGKARITGYQSLEEAHTVAVLLRSGALPVKVEVLYKNTVGPTLGLDSLTKSVKAGIVGLIAILVFMAVYYRVPGLVANLALIIYAMIVLGIFIGLNGTMTLPGIAGFLLSLGIAVDTNIIIFERIKEELRSGKSLRSAVDTGFKRGIVAVIDANATTLIAAGVLYFLGHGRVQGFAVTLSIGILASLFTAITLTKWMLQLVAASNLVRNPKYFGA